MQNIRPTDQKVLSVDIPVKWRVMPFKYLYFQSATYNQACIAMWVAENSI